MLNVGCSYLLKKNYVLCLSLNMFPLPRWKKKVRKDVKEISEVLRTRIPLYLRERCKELWENIVFSFSFWKKGWFSVLKKGKKGRIEAPFLSI